MKHTEETTTFIAKANAHHNSLISVFNEFHNNIRNSIDKIPLFSGLDVGELINLEFRVTAIGKEYFITHETCLVDDAWKGRISIESRYDRKDHDIYLFYYINRNGTIDGELNNQKDPYCIKNEEESINLFSNFICEAIAGKRINL